MTSSSDVVDYSLRPNKSIERSLVFDSTRLLVDRLQLRDLVYVGMGSVWFSDFHQAHRQLDVETMVSIEVDKVTHARAAYNAPYRTVEVIKGRTDEVIPDLLGRDVLRHRPWMVWLDYDHAVDEQKLLELTGLVNTLPEDSVLITTFSASGGPYGRPAQRSVRLGQLYGNALPEDLDLDDYKDVALARVLASATQNLLLTKALDYARPGGYVPAFQLTYKDGTPMATIGGFLPSPANREGARSVISDPAWLGMPDAVIDVPLLTAKEALTLQEALPVGGALTRTDVQAMGFDLRDGQAESFQRHYLRYPTYSRLSR